MWRCDLLSSEEVYARVVAEGGRRRRRRVAGLAAALLVAVVAVAVPVIRSAWPEGDGSATVTAGEPEGTSEPSNPGESPVGPLVIPGTDDSPRVEVPAALPAMPSEAPAWTALPPTRADLEALAAALGVGGRVVEAAEGFSVEGGAAPLVVREEPNVADWRFEMGPCEPGVCVIPDGPEAGPDPVVDVRPPGTPAPDDPPLELTPVAVSAARRIAARLDAEAVRLALSPGEWRAQVLWRSGEVASSGFTVHVRPDGSVRLANGMLVRPGAHGKTIELVGVDAGLRRLARGWNTANRSLRLVLCDGGPCDPTVVVTGVALTYGLERHPVEGRRFAPYYAFTITGGGEGDTIRTYAVSAT